MTDIIKELKTIKEEMNIIGFNNYEINVRLNIMILKLTNDTFYTEMIKLQNALLEKTDPLFDGSPIDQQTMNIFKETVKLFNTVYIWNITEQEYAEIKYKYQLQKHLNKISSYFESYLQTRTW